MVQNYQEHILERTDEEFKVSKMSSKLLSNLEMLASSLSDEETKEHEQSSSEQQLTDICKLEI